MTEQTAEALRRIEAAELVRAVGAGPRTTRRSTWSRPRGSRSGTTSSSGCSPRRGATAPTSSRCRCPPPCRRPRWRGCATTPTASPATWPGRCRGRRRRRRASAPASTPGSRRASASRTCSTPTTCRAAPTPASTTSTTSPTLIETFEQGPFGDRVPHRVEAPFALVLGRPGGARPDRRGLRRARRRRSWSSTGRPTASATADPLQLALYRLAWAELHGVPVERVRAAFYYVRTGLLVEPPTLPGAGRARGARGGSGLTERRAPSAISTMCRRSARAPRRSSPRR